MNKKEINELLNLSYESVNSNLKFAETKNTFLVTFNSAIIGIIVAFLTGEKQISFIPKAFIVTFTLLILFATLISVFSFVPLNKIGKILIANCDSQKPKFMFYLYNASEFKVNDKERYKKFEKALKKNCNYDDDLSFLEKELIFQIVDLSNIAFAKFKLFSYAVYVELIATILFGVFLILA